jgi:hypothetical protein
VRGGAAQQLDATVLIYMIQSVQLRVTFRYIALGLVAVAAAMPVGQAQARTPTLGEWLICAGEATAVEGVLNANLSPASGATVQAGTPVTLSGASAAPLAFAVASSTELLAHPDIAGGPGTAQPGASSPATDTYTFTATAAAGNTPRTIYWSASFSSTSLASCAGQEAHTFSSAVHTLSVLPAPATPTQPAPSPSQQAPAPPVAAPPLAVEVAESGGFRLAHPLLAYRVHCTASCSGTTSVRAFVQWRHRKHVEPEPALDLASKLVSIATAGGGDLKLSERYEGGALRLIRKILKAGGKVELQIDVEVVGAGGTAVHAQQAIWLHL